MRLFILCLSTLALSGCASSHDDLKSPCAPSASLSQNPCVHIPLNMAGLEPRNHKNS